MVRGVVVVRVRRAWQRARGGERDLVELASVGFTVDEEDVDAHLDEGVRDVNTHVGRV